MNSYDDVGPSDSTLEFAVVGHAGDGVTAAVRHAQHRVSEVAWHPERYADFRPADVALAREWFHA